ncbi:MAG: hypothetical protein ABSE27_06510 [Acidobacteriaceae bacterium]|jgi:hypothetical protein
MGHTRLGEIPKSRKWREVVALVTGEGLAGGVAPTAADMTGIAAKTLDAARKGLDKAVADAGVHYTFYLLTQLALAARSPDWEAALDRHGIRLANDSSLFDFTAEVQDAIDRHLRQHPSGATDLSEMAQQSAGEAITSLAATRTGNLFGGSSDDVRNAMHSFSTKKGFGELGQRFFGRFVARFLNFYLSRVTAAHLGSPRLRDLGDIPQFNDALRSHCDQSARIVRDFCGTWYSKTNYEQGINPENTSRFLAFALEKMRSELAQQRAEQ